MTQSTVSTASAPPLVSHVLTRAWHFLLFRGIVSLLFGIAAVAWPALTLASLIYLFAAFAIVDGVCALSAAMSGRTKAFAPTWWLVLVGFLGIAAGIATIAYPALTALTLLMFIGVWAIVRGIFEILGAIEMRKTITNEWALILSGLVSVVFGGLVLMRPGAGALAMIWAIGIYAILAGVLLTTVALRLKKHT